MSVYLPRDWLNQLYVGLIVFNYWSTTFFHTIFHRSPTTRYFITLLNDLVFDMVSSIGVTIALVGIYWHDVEPEAPDLFGWKWFQDIWLSYAINEFQIILVVSLTDLASKLVFAIGMINTLNTLKRFISTAADRKPVNNWRKSWKSIIPDLERSASAQDQSLIIRNHFNVNAIIKNHPLATKLHRAVFAVWGVVVLALHVAPGYNTDIPSCIMQVQPWGVARPSCNRVLINYHSEGIDGRESEVNDRLNEFHPPSVAEVLVRHCPIFEMPPIIRSFSSLSRIKTYNTSIEVWSADAAISDSSNPELIYLVFARTNFKNGQVSPGLQATDFPSTVKIIAFLVSNIDELPDDINTKWLFDTTIDLTWANLSRVPNALIRVGPRSVVLPGNPIQAAPKELFELKPFVYLDLRSTLISSLPVDFLHPSSTLTSFNLDDTNVSYFPEWVDKWLEVPDDVLYPEWISAARSPYCLERNRIFAGKQTEFTSTASTSRLMDASTNNWPYLKRSVACTPTIMHAFPLEVEGMLSSVH